MQKGIYKHSEETRKKISKSLRGKIVSDEHKKHLSLALKGNKNCLGRKHSEETKKKIRQSNLGHKISEETRKKMGEAKKGKRGNNTGNRHSEETKKRISQNLYGKYRGDKNPSWKGGKWRWIKKQALLRDDYTCQICGLREPEIMEVDHIKPKSIYPNFKNDLNNLITLCPNCHRRKTLREYRNKIYGNK